MAIPKDVFRDVFYSSTDGLALHARVYGQDNHETMPVVCLPGLTRNARDFHELAIFLSRRADTRRRVVAFDYRGRGGSAYDRKAKNYTVPMEAADIVAGMMALGVEHGYFIGTSRGGLIVHALASSRPGAVRAVVFNDIGPVVEGEGLAHIRSYLYRAPKPKSVTEAIAIQRAAHGQAFSALKDADWERFVSAIYREHRGKPVPDFDPKVLNQIRDFDIDKPIADLWPQFGALAHAPMLAIRGENSKLLSAETLAEMARRHPDCQTLTVEGQGHAPLLETGTLPQTIAAFFDKVDAKAG